jgi:hypothetical protein
MTFEQSAQLMKRYEEGLSGYIFGIALAKNTTHRGQ